MIKLIKKFLCSIGRHDLEYLPSPEGIMHGIFGPCRCRRCSYRHDGFPYPRTSSRSESRYKEFITKIERDKHNRYEEETIIIEL